MSSLTKAQLPHHALTPEKIDLLKDTICKGGTDDELQLFIHVCNRLQLDPFARQIFSVKRWDKNLRREVMSAQVSIDGLRLVAQRTGQYEGQTVTQWCGQDGKWVDVWLSDKPPAAARVGVYRQGFREALFATARWDSYVATTKEGGVTAMWARMPDLMLAKCAEALALRKAFPSELSGAYTTEEMGTDEAPVYAETPNHAIAPTTPRNAVQPGQRGRPRKAQVAQRQAVNGTAHEASTLYQEVVSTITMATCQEDFNLAAELAGNLTDSYEKANARALWKRQYDAVMGGNTPDGGDTPDGRGAAVRRKITRAAVA